VSIQFRARGITLIELLVGVAIIGILATLAGTAVLHGTARARVSNAAFEVGALYAAAQLRATSRGVPHYVVFHDDGTDFGVYLLERPDALGPYDWAAADVVDAVQVQGTRVEHLRLSSERGLGFMDLDAPPLQPRPLPAPFSSIPLTAAGRGGLLGGCSFCTTGTGGTRGVLRFSPDGTVRVVTGSIETGGAIAFAPDTRGGQSGAPRVVVIASPAGAVRIF
jgi:prepilin-type N-terminal cleavage/methylation domain-containing protein